MSDKSPEGRLLMAAIARLTTQLDTDKTPGQVIGVLNELENKMYSDKEGKAWDDLVEQTAKEQGAVLPKDEHPEPLEAPEIVDGLLFLNAHMPGRIFKVAGVDVPGNLFNVSIEDVQGIASGWMDYDWNIFHAKAGFERGEYWKVDAERMADGEWSITKEYR